MAAPWTLYIVGSGVSARLVPIAARMKGAVLPMYLSIGIWPATPAALSPILRRILGGPSSGDPISEALLYNMTRGPQELLVQKALSPTCSLSDIPPEYGVFRVVGRPSLLFNFNLDGLARRYCSQHVKVLEAHGELDWPYLTDDVFPDLLYEVTSADYPLPRLTPKVLLEPEPGSITNSHPYAKVTSLFQRFQAVVIIGYSFSRWRSSRDDAESFEWLVELLRTYRRPVYILSTSPEELAAEISDRVRSFAVMPVGIRWYPFARALVESLRPRERLRDLLLGSRLRTLLQCYEARLDMDPA